MSRVDGWAVEDCGWGASPYVIRRAMNVERPDWHQYQHTPKGKIRRFATMESAERALARIPVGEPWPPPTTPAESAERARASLDTIVQLRRALRSAMHAADLLDEGRRNGDHDEQRASALEAVEAYRDALALDLNSLETQAVADSNRALAR